ncbi:MAG: BamA/OMP85 family outer membrane protein [Woeseiaceae bacterium]
MRHLSLLTLVLVLLPALVQAQAGDGRIYVKRIIFLGTENIDDDVLRRELLQVEGTYIDTVAVEKSRLRLERLPYVEHAEVSQRPVKDAPDQVDVLIAITEAPAREYRVGGAFSESLRLSGFGYFVNENLLGTGQRFFARVDASEFHTAARLSHTDPYAHPNGVSRTIGLSSKWFDQLTADTTELEGDLVTASLEYGYRIAERQSIRLGLALEDAELTTGALASTQLEDWVRNNGNPTVRGNESSTDTLTAELLFGWHHDTRDRKVFPNTGLEQELRLRAAVPGSDVEYYAVEYELTKYWPLNSGWTAMIGTRLGFGQKYGSKTTSLAPNLNWFAGGPDTVRGYRENRLGPQDSLGNPYGGNLLVSNQFELMMPLPKKWQKHARIGFFYDIGNVFSTEDVSFLDDAGQNLDYTFDFSGLRQSVGISAQILMPLGLLRLSYGVPLNAEDDNPNRFLRDDIQRFQIAVGVSF